MHENADPKRVERLTRARQLMADAAVLVGEELTQTAANPGLATHTRALAEAASLVSTAIDRVGGPLSSLEHGDHGLVADPRLITPPSAP